MVSVSLRVRVDSTVDRGAEKARQCLFVKEVAYASLAPEQKELLASAEEAMESAYNPYSGFSVGAALLTVDGKMIAGSNFENAAYSPGICAERAALVRANSESCRMFRTIAVIARGARSRYRRSDRSLRRLSADALRSRAGLRRQHRDHTLHLEKGQNRPDDNRRTPPSRLRAERYRSRCGELAKIVAGRLIKGLSRMALT